MGKKIIVIGAGFSGLSTACYLAKAGHDVTILEKNNQSGGRAMVMKKQGFTFDLGPSWYLMPDVFEEFFADFDRMPSDYYDLVQLNPSYRVFTDKTKIDVPTAPDVFKLFNKVDEGSSEGLKILLQKTSQEYELVRRRILTKPMLNLKDVLNTATIRMLLIPSLIGSYDARIKRYINHPDLVKILEFMVVFMGGSPKNIPGLYSLLTHVDMNLGNWYPMGGMGKLVEAYVALAHELGVKFRYNHEVSRIITSFREVTGVETAHGVIKCDAVVAATDYYHVETKLLDERQRTYGEKYWKRKTLSPSGLLIYLGVNKKIPGLMHHNMCFDADWDKHFDEVFKKKEWSKDPLFYVCVPSKTDSTVAPKGMETIFILAPMAAGAQPEDKQLIETTVERIITRLEHKIGTPIRENIVVKDVRAQNYFRDTFNAYQGNAFGLAHTLFQSAIFRPRIASKKITGLYYAGQYTNPGTGVPIATLSGKVVSDVINHNYGKKSRKAAF